MCGCVTVRIYEVPHIILRNSRPRSVHNRTYSLTHSAAGLNRSTCFDHLHVYFDWAQIRILHLHCLSRARTHKYLWHFIQIFSFFRFSSRSNLYHRRSRFFFCQLPTTYPIPYTFQTNFNYDFASQFFIFVLLMPVLVALDTVMGNGEKLNWPWRRCDEFVVCPIEWHAINAAK